jgi:predicted nucleic acid-binding protein
LSINNPKIGLDSQCLSYLLDAIAGISEPTDSLVLEKIALTRAWFYKPGDFSFHLTPTIISEIREIKQKERREFHENLILPIFCIHNSITDIANVRARAEEFKVHHSKLNDCLVLAEAEELRLDIVLTYDSKFWKRLCNKSNVTKLMKPTEYWASLSIPIGSAPQYRPYDANSEDANPLSFQHWWRW